MVLNGGNNLSREGSKETSTADIFQFHFKLPADIHNNIKQALNE